MSIDAHIKFDGVDGESAHEGHTGEIDIYSWSWGEANPVSLSSTGGMSQGKPTIQDFTFTHGYDKSSPVLAKHCAAGKHFDKVVVSLSKSTGGEKPEDYATITFKTAYITSVSLGGSSGGDVHETVTFAFEDIEFVYKAQKKEGGVGGDVKFGYNQKTKANR